MLNARAKNVISGRVQIIKDLKLSLGSYQQFSSRVSLNSRMKGGIGRTKVVLRHLPPTISQSSLTEQIDGRFAGRYNWVSFRHGNSSEKHPSYSRGYIDFKRPEDVIEFAEFFDGHVFVNEKGSQFKTIVEYAPSQRVPRQWSKRDGREGTINKDHEYMEFVEFISKPVDHLPNAEIQLERREAERAGSAKDALIVTPLMDFVRQKRAGKGGSRRSLPNGKPTRRTSGATSGSPSSVSSKRGAEKRRISTTMYVLRDSAKNTSGKEKSTNILVPKRDDQQVSGNSVTSAAVSGTEVLEDKNGVSGTTNMGKKKILLLRGKEKEIPHVSGGLSLQHSATSIKNSLGSNTLRPNQRHEASGRIIKSILRNKDTRQSPSSSVVHSEQQILTSNQEKDKRPPRPPNVQLFLKDDTNGHRDDKIAGNDLHSFCSDKQEKHTRNKDRPDRGVWTPLRRSDGSHASDKPLSSSASQPKQSLVDSAEVTRGETENDILNAHSGEFNHIGSGLCSHSSLDNGSHKHSGRRGPVHNVKDGDSSSILNEGKPLKRGGSSGYGSYEKQVWVQKSSSCS